MRRRPRILVPAAAGAAALALVAAACGQPSKPVEVGAPPPSSTPPTENPTTSAPAVPTFPLTGLEMTDPAAAAHPAVVVKMDNSPDARPQSGINEADIVYEELVEGITRYALVYQSQMSGQVGPVRSARSTDPPLIANLARPLLAWSGGNPGVTGEVSNAASNGFLVDAGVNSFSGDYWRDHSRIAPHNLYTNTGALLEHAAPAGATAPEPLFRYRQPTDPPAGGTEAAGMVIDYGLNVRCEYVWDAERGGWDRFQVDERHDRANSATVDSNGVQAAPPNVVIMFLQYGQSPSDARSPMAISSGTGEALVLTQGHVIHGTWSRPTALSPWELLDDAGQPITLTPGRTWVSLPEVGSTVLPIDQDTANQLLAIRK